MEGLPILSERRQLRCFGRRSPVLVVHVRFSRLVEKCGRAARGGIFLQRPSPQARVYFWGTVGLGDAYRMRLIESRQARPKARLRPFYRCPRKERGVRREEEDDGEALNLFTSLSLSAKTPTPKWCCRCGLEDPTVRVRALNGLLAIVRLWLFVQFFSLLLILLRSRKTRRQASK